MSSGGNTAGDRHYGLSAHLQGCLGMALRGVALQTQGSVQDVPTAPWTLSAGSQTAWSVWAFGRVEAARLTDESASAQPDHGRRIRGTYACHQKRAWKKISQVVGSRRTHPGTEQEP